MSSGSRFDQTRRLGELEAVNQDLRARVLSLEIRLEDIASAFDHLIVKLEPIVKAEKLRRAAVFQPLVEHLSQEEDKNVPTDT